ncbi:MAG: serine hydrolase domain-containing protein [Cyclobacteriaceae bacterium]
MKKKIILFSLLTLLIICGFFVRETYQKLPIISGYHSKHLCSCVFGAKRTEESVLNLDLSFFPINWASYTINKKEKTVTSNVFGLKYRKSIYREGFGCTLLADYKESEVRKGIFPNITTPAYSPENWPMGDLIELSPKEAALKQSLQPVLDQTFHEEDINNKKNTTSVVVLYNGQLIAERYRKDFDSHTPVIGWSMTKSITSALIGILIKEGKLALHSPAPVSEWQQDDRKNITLNNLLQMTSGLDWLEEYNRMSSAVDMLYNKGNMYQYAINSSYSKKPDSDWYYSSGTTNIISGILRNTFNSNDDYWRFPYEALFHKIGMTSTFLEPDAAGMYAGSSYAFATPRDFARFGLLYYNNGVWNGDTIITPEWVNYTKTPVPAAPKGEYGAQWWLNTGKNGNYRIEGVPTDTYFCDGFQGQRIYVIPSEKLVVVRTGITVNKSAFNERIFLHSIIEAVHNNE